MVIIARTPRVRKLLWLILVVVLGYWFWHPVCDPVESSDLAKFNPPIADRAKESQWGIRTWQLRNGRWYQCKPWIARQFFF